MKDIIVKIGYTKIMIKKDSIIMKYYYSILKGKYIKYEGL